MVLLISLLLVAQGAVATSGSRWASPDALIEDSLGSYVAFAADYNYSNGDLYIACVPDSGYYFGPDSIGILVFRSTDHGDSGGLILRDVYYNEGWGLRDIDLVATRSDTVYILLSWHNTGANDGMQVAKIYDTGGSDTLEWIGPVINATEIRSPRLERDDFDDFYLYMAYLDIAAGTDYLHVLRSVDRGYNWDVIVQGNADEYQDVDIEVSDSSFYCLSTYQYLGDQYMELFYLRNRGDVSTFGGQDLFINDTLTKKKLEYPRIGATTTLPDTEQVVYAFFSQEDSVSGDYDLLYKYSEDGGGGFSGTDTLVKGSYSPILCDLRGYQVEPNEYMDLVFSFTSSVPSFENTWLWSEEGSPTNWQGTTSVATGANRSMPEIVYSPGVAVGGAAVVYNDSLGNLWFDAPWRESGIDETLTGNKDKIRSQIVLSGSLVKLNSSGAVVYDVTGREITELDGDSWNLKNKQGEEVDGGIYFIVDRRGGKLKLLVIE